MLVCENWVFWFQIHWFQIQSDTLELLQKRAIMIIFCGIDYHMSLILAGLDTLYSRREHIAYYNVFINRTLCIVHLVLIIYYQSNVIL